MIDELHIMPREEEQLKCAGCGTIVTDNNYDEVIFLDKCCHCVCKSCIKLASEKQFPDVKCPQLNCNKTLFEFEIKQALGDKSFDELQSS